MERFYAGEKFSEKAVHLKKWSHLIGQTENMPFHFQTFSEK